MVFIATSNHPQIQHRSEQKPQHVDTFHRHPLVEHPGIDQRGQGQKDEAQDQEQETVAIWASQVSGKKEQQREHKPRGQQDQDQEATGHDLIAYRRI